MDNYFEMPDDVRKMLGEFAMKSSALPFPAPMVWVVNGDAKMKNTTPAQYFGGWAMKAEEAVPVVTGWDNGTVITSKDDEFPIVTSRRVIFAPIASRSCWVDKQDNQHFAFQPGSRLKLHVLAMMATNGGDTIHPWGTVILSAKGYQAKYLKNALIQWDEFTRPARNEFTNGLPAWAFYCSVGTFQKERKVVMVGTGDQSPITPVEIYKPENLSVDLLRKLYVTPAIAKNMADFRTAAANWIKSWNDEE